jgi:uroporphyrinogen-III synthase
LARRWDLAAVTSLVEACPQPDIVLVTSSVTAAIVAAAAPRAWPDARWAAVGPSTARRLEELGLPCHVVPERATAADLVHALGDVAGRTVVYPHADLAHPRTRDELGERGAEVHTAVAYRNELPDGAGKALLDALPVHATPVLSGSAAQRLAELVPAERHGELGAIVAIGPSTEAVARSVGLPVARVASPHTLGGVLQALAKALTGS